MQLAMLTICVIYTKKFGRYLASWEQYHQMIHRPIAEAYPSIVLKIIDIVKHLWEGSFNLQQHHQQQIK